MSNSMNFSFITEKSRKECPFKGCNEILRLGQEWTYHIGVHHGISCVDDIYADIIPDIDEWEAGQPLAACPHCGRGPR